MFTFYTAVWRRLVTCIRSRKMKIFILWPWTLAYDLDLRIWPRYGKDEPARLMSRLKVILFKNYSLATHAHTHTHTHTWLCALPGPLKCSIKKMEHCINMPYRINSFVHIIIIIIIIINGNVYGAILMTMVTASVHPVHLMNADWAPGGRQPSD